MAREFGSELPDGDKVDHIGRVTRVHIDEGKNFAVVDKFIYVPLSRAQCWRPEGQDLAEGDLVRLDALRVKGRGNPYTCTRIMKMSSSSGESGGPMPSNTNGYRPPSGGPPPPGAWGGIPQEGAGDSHRRQQQQPRLPPSQSGPQQHGSQPRPQAAYPPTAGYSALQKNPYTGTAQAVAAWPAEEGPYAFSEHTQTAPPLHTAERDAYSREYPSRYPIVFHLPRPSSSAQSETCNRRCVRPFPVPM